MALERITLHAQFAFACRETQLMHHLAATMRMMIGDIDLTVSDRHCAFVLCQALQQLQRRRRVARSLLPPDKWREQVRFEEGVHLLAQDQTRQDTSRLLLPQGSHAVSCMQQAAQIPMLLLFAWVWWHAGCHLTDGTAPAVCASRASAASRVCIVCMHPALGATQHSRVPS